MKHIVLLDKLEKLGVTLEVSGTQLKVSAGRSILSDELISSIKLCRDEIIAHLSNKKVASDIQRLERESYYPASSVQRMLHFYQEIHPTSCVYNLPSLFFLGSDIDTAKVSRVLNQLINRHDSLRTCFKILDGEIVQVVANQITVELPIIDSSLRELQNLREDFVQPFRLDKVPLWKAMILFVKDIGYYLFMDFHHIICDGLSIEILKRQFNSLMAEEVLPSPCVQYKEYVAWTLCKTQVAKREEQGRFWKSVFADYSPSFQLPYIFNNYNPENYKAATVSFAFSANELLGLKEVGSRQNLKPFSLFAGLLAIFIHQVADREDFIVGTTVSGRNDPHFEEVIGMFANTLPFRYRVQREDSIAKVLKQVNAVNLSGFNNQEYLFEDLIDFLSITRTPGSNPVFDTLFSFADISESAPSDFVLDAKAEIEPVEIDSKYNFQFGVFNAKSHVYIRLIYNSTTISNDMAERYVQYLRELALSCTNPDLKMSELPPFDAMNGASNGVLPKASGETAIVPGEILRNQEVEEKLRLIWSQVLGVPENSIQSDRTFFDNGGHSLNILKMVKLIKTTFGVYVPIAYIYKYPAIPFIEHAILSKQFFNSDINFFNSPSLPRKIFCLPPIVTYGYCYKSIAALIPDFCFCSFNFLKIDDPIMQIVDRIIDIQPEGSIVLMGYSAGARPVYPITSALERKGRHISKIILLDGYWNKYSGIGDAAAIKFFCSELLQEASLEFVIDELAERIEAYDDLLKSIEFGHKVNSDIYFLLSEGYDEKESEEHMELEEERVAQLLSSFSHGKLEIIRAFGTHKTLLNEQNLFLNAKLISNILGQLK